MKKMIILGLIVVALCGASAAKASVGVLPFSMKQYQAVKNLYFAVANKDQAIAKKCMFVRDGYGPRRGIVCASVYSDGSSNSEWVARENRCGIAYQIYANRVKYGGVRHNPHFFC